MPAAALDADTLSEVMKARDPRARDHARRYLATHGRFVFSTITRFEMLRGLKAKRASRQIAASEERCGRSAVLPLTDDIIVQAADIYAELYRRGQLTSDADILIAAAVLVHGLILVADNTAHFRQIPGLDIGSWRAL